MNTARYNKQLIAERADARAGRLLELLKKRREDDARELDKFLASETRKTVGWLWWKRNVTEEEAKREFFEYYLFNWIWLPRIEREPCRHDWLQAEADKWIDFADWARNADGETVEVSPETYEMLF